MREIPLRNKQDEIVAYVKVDDIDYETLMQRRWHRTAYGYACSTAKRDVKLWMHRAVYELAHGTVPRLLDHKDRDKLNNQRYNLRPATDTENNLNRPLGTLNTTGYFGVRKDKRTRRYQAHSTHEGRWFSIGYFDSDRDAAIAHDMHMKTTYPNEFLNLNVPDSTEEETQRVAILLAAPKQRKGKSRYLGVIHFPYDGRAKCWHARISVGGENHSGGYYLTEEEAARAYNQKAIELLGDKAKLNIIP